jgi:hypothetical protein
MNARGPAIAPHQNPAFLRHSIKKFRITAPLQAKFGCRGWPIPGLAERLQRKAPGKEEPERSVKKKRA